MEASGRLRSCRSYFSIYKLKDEYTKLVVIVNATETVDKFDFFHNISSLRSR
jgi:hypothetical protein